MTDRWLLSWRALPRRAVLGGCAAGVALGIAASPSLDGSDGVLVLRGGAVLVACAVAFAVDDPSADVLAASPTPLRARVAVRVALALGVASLFWSALAALVAWRAQDVPVAALSLEALALAALGIAVAAALQGLRGVADPGVLTAPVVGGAVLAANLLPTKWMLLAPGPGMPGWGAAHQRWAALLVVAVLVAAVATRDPAARRRLRGGTRPPPDSSAGRQAVAPYVAKETAM